MAPPNPRSVSTGPKKRLANLLIIFTTIVLKVREVPSKTKLTRVLPHTSKHPRLRPDSEGTGLEEGIPILQNVLRPPTVGMCGNCKCKAVQYDTKS
jgi:hypothetical protein